MCLMLRWDKFGVFHRTSFPSLQSCWFCWILHSLNIIIAFIPGRNRIFLSGMETAGAVPIRDWLRMGEWRRNFIYFFSCCFLPFFSLPRTQGSWQDFNPEWVDGGEDPCYCCNHQFWNGSRQSQRQVCEAECCALPESETWAVGRECLSLSVTWYMRLKCLMNTC